MGHAAYGQAGQVRQCEFGTPQVEVPGKELSSEYGGDLEIDHLGRYESLAAQSGASGVTRGGVVAQRWREDARVNDEHDPPQ